MKKKDNSYQDRSEAQSEESQRFQNLVDKILSVPKKELDRREAELKKTKGN